MTRKNINQKRIETDLTHNIIISILQTWQNIVFRFFEPQCTELYQNNIFHIWKRSQQTYT